MRNVWNKAKEAIKGGPWLTGMLILVAACALIGFIVSYKLPTSGNCNEDREQVRKNNSQASIFLTNPQEPPGHLIEVIDATQTKVKLGRGAGPATTTIGLRTDTVSSTSAPVQLSVQSFRRGDNPNFTQAVAAWAQFRSPQLMTLYLCFERFNGGDKSHGIDAFNIDPGEYTGTVLLTDPRLPTTTVPFTVDVAYRNEFRVLLLWLAVVPVGAAYLMVIRRPPGVSADEISRKELDDFIKTPTGFAAIIAGAVASFSIYENIYLSSDVWGSSSTQWFGLLGGMFAAFVAAGTTFRFAANLKDSQSTTPAKTKN